MNEEYINPIINNTQMKWNLTCYLSTQSQHKCATEEITYYHRDTEFNFQSIHASNL